MKNLRNEILEASWNKKMIAKKEKKNLSTNAKANIFILTISAIMFVCYVISSLIF